MLRAQWLSTLGPIMWDFSQLRMKFSVDGKEIQLQGLSSPEDQLVGEEKINRELKKQREGVVLQINFMHGLVGNLKSFSSTCQINPELESILQLYPDVFKEPIGLPPKRSHDHKIPTHPNSGPISVRP